MILLVSMFAGYSSISYGQEDLSLCKQGWNATQSNNHAQALDLFEACIKSGNLSDSSLARTYRNIGIVYRRSGKPEASIPFYDKALSLKPSDTWNDYVNRGNAWSEQGKYDEALKDYDLALKIKPNFNEAHYNRGIVFERQGKFEDAKSEFLKAYEHGLRSQLLFDRLVTYGLLKPSGQ